MSPGWRRARASEEVATVEINGRLSALTSACAPATPWLATVAQARTNVLGLSAVEIQATTAPVFGFRAVGGASVKINNYMGNTSAMSEGMADTTSGTVAVLVQQ